jgi:hypothetical protein
MWHADYVLNPFNLSGLKGIEARGAIGIYDSRGVTVSGLEITESGGDGVCVVGCVGCELHNLTIDGAYRDAITVAACNGLLVDGCALLNTGAPGRYNGGEKLTTSNGGIAGACAVDVEPDSEGAAVLNLTFRDVRAAGNAGTAFNVHGDTSHSIRFERARVHAFGGVHAGHSAFSLSMRAPFRSAFIYCHGVCPCHARARCNHFKHCRMQHAVPMCGMAAPDFLGTIELHNCSAESFPAAALNIQRGQSPPFTVFTPGLSSAWPDL